MPVPALRSRNAVVQQLEPRLPLAGDPVAQWLANDVNASSDDGALNGAMMGAEVPELRVAMMARLDRNRPSAVDDAYTTAEDSFIFLVPAASGVLVNDSDPESHPLTANLVDDVQQGQLKLQPDGSFIYVPAANFFGIDTFTYTANDLQASSNVATVTIQVTPVYDPPVPIDDSYRLLPSQLLSVDVANGLLSNDANPDRVALTAVLDRDVGQGALLLNNDGSFTYDPGGFVGATTFGYRIDDGISAPRDATVTLRINTPPLASDDQYDVTEDTLFIADAAQGILANDTDVESDALTMSIVSEPAHGSLTSDADGSFTFLPEPDYFGPDRFTYRAADWADESATRTVRLNILAKDDPPVVEPDMYFGLAGQVISRSAEQGLLANDSDIDSLSLSSRLASGPSHGALTLDKDGSFSFTPDAGYMGTDTFTYTVSDATSTSGAVEVLLYVGTSPIRISEILAANVTSLGTRTRTTVDGRFRGDEEREDWIELQNVTDAPFDVGGYYLTDDDDAAKKWRIPDGVTIPAFGYLTVLASRRNLTDPGLDEQGLLHTNFALRVSGEYLALTSPNGLELDKLDPYPKQVPDISYGRTDSGEMGYFVTPTPGDANGAIYAGLVADTVLSVEHGFFSDPFQVQVSNVMEGVEFRYTTDGSTPTLNNGNVYAGPINVTTTTVLRAAAFKDNYVPSDVLTSTYLFIQDVIRQDNSPPGYPSRWVGANGNGTTPADYEMDPEITENPAYRDIIDDALLAIPTVSIVTDFDNFFDPETGIYQRPDQRRWERPTSVELIFPDGRQGFQIDAGVRIQGGHTRSPSGSPKHSLRLRFRGIYGAEKLQYDWFGGNAVDEFDTIVLRAGGNQSWIHTNTFLGDNRSRAQYVRDQWAKDTLNAMGYPASNNDYAHLYINGIYWGLYNPTERPTADFAASYFGGSREEYDVLNAGTVLDGDSVAWRQLAKLFRTADLTDESQYQAVAAMLDIEPYIDYMILNQYGGNKDWDSHNWYAIRRRVPDAKFRFVPWDSEFMFISENDNRLSVADGTPGQLFRRLQRNDEFRIQLADQVQRLFFNDGLLTPQSVLERWEARSDQITDAIVAESARWGDYRRDVVRRAGPFELLERDDQWVTERQRLLDEYFPNRTRIVLAQYRAAGLFPSIDTATFNQRGGAISSAFDISLTASEGVVFYTTDGSDPRLAGGDVNPNAIEYTGPFRLGEPSKVRTRTLSGDEWSAIDEASFVVDVVPADASNLRISEISYNPADPTEEEIAAGHDNNDDFEFIELVNISDQRIDLTRVQLRQSDVNGDLEGVVFDFSSGPVTYLEPGQYVLAVEDASAFSFRYGERPVAGQWTGGLSNGGEQITLVVDDVVVHQFAYDDDWYSVTDGGGSTLEFIDPASSRLDDWRQKTSWRPSDQIGGSPGTAPLSPVPGDANRDGVFDSRDLTLVLQAGEYNDGVPGNSTFDEGDWNGDGDFTSADLIHAFQAGTYELAAAALDDRNLTLLAAALSDVSRRTDT